MGNRRLDRVVLGLLLAPLLVAIGSAQTARPDPELLEQVRLGLQARSENRLAQAETYFEAVVRMAPEMAEGHMNLGWIYHRQSKLREAIRSLERALELKPSLQEVHAVLGMDYLIAGRFRDAQRTLEQAREADPATRT